jgi:hypothetical protein
MRRGCEERDAVGVRGRGRGRGHARDQEICCLRLLTCGTATIWLFHLAIRFTDVHTTGLIPHSTSREILQQSPHITLHRYIYAAATR